MAEDRPQQNHLLGGQRRRQIRQLAGTLLDRLPHTDFPTARSAAAESALTDIRRRRACRSFGHPRTSTPVGDAQRRRQPSTLVGVQGVRSLFEAPKGRLDAHPARTQELVQLSSMDAEATPGVVLGELAGFQPLAARSGMLQRDPSRADSLTV